MTHTKKIYIIAEAGVNHNGSLNLAKKLILTAKKCGADAVKFQIFNKREQISDIAPTAPYQNKNTKKKSMLKMADKYDFKWENHIILKKLCDKIGIDYMASCFDKTSVDFYKNILKVKTLKIASSEIDNLRLLKYVNKKFKKVILSTGMSNINEIFRGIKCLNKVDKLYLMQCTSLYPTELNEVNLNVLAEFKKKFKLPIGFSDHTFSNIASIVSVGFGVELIEKHLTLNNSLQGPDHKMSLNPLNFKKFVSEIRNAEKTLGNYLKNPSREEKKMIKFSRRGLFASTNIEKGTKIQEKHISYKRPSNFLPISFEKKIIGKKLKKSILKNEPFKKTYFNE
ncbi:N-acetylneuraminate synthase family protein [Candidatus Pelagibacter sp.]|nr:N-acetylneuraminate synthase family protein [Candidatus Pelagibacter sp.]